MGCFHCELCYVFDLIAAVIKVCLCVHWCMCDTFIMMAALHGAKSSLTLLPQTETYLGGMNQYGGFAV